MMTKFLSNKSMHINIIHVANHNKITKENVYTCSIKCMLSLSVKCVEMGNPYIPYYLLNLQLKYIMKFSISPLSYLGYYNKL